MPRARRGSTSTPTRSRSSRRAALIATHAHPSSGAGPEPLRLLVGSEGALGVITEAWMRVVPRPTHRASASVAYKDFAAGGVASARALAQSGLLPSNARLLDATEGAPPPRAVRRRERAFLVGFESADHPMDAWLARLRSKLCRDHGGEVVAQKTEGHAWKQAFFDAP